MHIKMILEYLVEAKLVGQLDLDMGRQVPRDMTWNLKSQDLKVFS